MANLLWFTMLQALVSVAAGVVGAVAAYYELALEAPFGFSALAYAVVVWFAGSRHANRGATWDHDTRDALAVGYATVSFVLSMVFLMLAGALLSAFDPYLFEELLLHYAPGAAFFAIALVISALVQYAIARLILRFAVRPAKATVEVSA